MAISDFLNKDPFAAGGVMDAPDLQMRQIYNKIALGGLAGQLSASEQRRLAVRQGLEQQSMQVAAQRSPNLQAILGQGGAPEQMLQGLQGLRARQPQGPAFQTALEGIMGAPASRQMAQQQEQFYTTQAQKRAEDIRKQRLETATSMQALGQDITKIGLSPMELVQAQTGGALMAERGTRKIRTDIGGVPTEITYDITGREIGRSAIQKTQLTPQEAADIERAKVQAAAETTRLEGEITKAYSAIPVNIRALEETAKARAQIQRGVTMGGGAELKLGLARGINAVIPGLIDTSKEEIAKGAFASMALAAAQDRLAKQGQVTEGERKIVAETVPTIRSEKEAALYMMDYMDAVAKRELARTKFIRDLKREKRSFDEYDITQGFNESNPLINFGFDPNKIGQTPSQAPSAAQQPSAKPTLVRQGGVTYRLGPDGQYSPVK